ncbi:sialin-like isoform X2 [Actinia tenebrosa]|uniref:Sialin n=1 Tax=Actinia tenebrosa TaxID=6105 RepID=A0A6P8HBH9_ACTTE|nr:sialin-like isoform X2 [Actinia tenebrosa]
MDESSPLIPRFSRENRRSSSKCSLSCRYALTILSMLGFCVMYTIRVNLSIALVEMANSTDTNNDDGLQSSNCDEEGWCNTTWTRSASKGRKFDWNEETRGIILGAFFYGFLVTQLPGGWLASKFGGKNVFGLGVLFTSVLTLLTPLAANHSVAALVAVRILEGLCQGVTYPSVQVLLSSWAPPLERSKLTTIAIAGCDIGNIIAQPISGWLCDSTFLGGWPSVFYVFGVLGILWYIAWFFLAYEKPASHPRISEEEKEYILLSIGTSQDKVLKKHSVPWLAIFTSPPVYANLIAFFCANWGYYTFLTSLPTYFKDILGFKILEDGILSSIPYLCCTIVEIIASVLADWLISTGSKIADVRKVFNTGAFLVPTCLLISVSYIGSDGKVLAVALISASMGFSALCESGYSVNQMDIAPRYVGIISGIGNAIGSASGVIAPFVVANSSSVAKGALHHSNYLCTRHSWVCPSC